MSKFETEHDRSMRYMWDADSGVDLVERGSGPTIDLEDLLSEPEPRRTRAVDEDGQGPRRKVLGLDVVIETPRGYERHGKDWSVVMPYDYGYIQGVQGADGDSLDCCIGEGPSNGWVYVVDQRQLGKKAFDEHKVFLNYPSMDAALDSFHRGHHKARDVYMDVTPMPLSAFHDWMRDHDMRRPASEA